MLLTGNPVANNDSYSAPFDSSLQISAPGVLANDTDPNQSPLTAHLISGPSHAANFHLNPDGSFYYLPNTGYLGPDSISYYDTDGLGYSSNTATIALAVQYSVSSDADLTKQVPLGEVKTSVQVLGGSHALSLAYDSVAAQPDAVIEGTFQFNFIQPVNDTVTGTLTFNGVQQPATYVNLAGMQSGNPNVDLSYQVDTSAMPTGRYPYTLTLSSPNMSAPATLSGAVNVVNDSAGAFGKGWDMPGLDHVYQNSVSGVPAGVLLTVGDGTGWYFTQGTGNSFTSPNGPYAFDTLTSVQGGGWQLVDKFGTKTNFDATGDQTSRALRTGETTTDHWASGLLTSIVDQFGRAVNLGYTSGELSSVSDFAGDVWNIAHTGALLTSVTDPNPGGGSPVWQYAYSGNYLSGVTDPDNNQSTYVLDSHHRIEQVNLPGGGDTQSTAEQSMGYGGSSPANPPNVTPSSAAVATLTDALSNHTTFATDAFGDPTVSTDAYGNQTFWQRDANGLVLKLTEPSPGGGAPAPVTNYTRDTLGNETSATGAHPTYGTYVFNAFSEWTSFTDSQNHQWTQAFDTNGNLKNTVDPLGNTVTYAVDSLGYPISMTTPAPNNATGTITTQYNRDQYERLVKTIFPDGATQLVGYDTLDRPTSNTDENNHTTLTNYDPLGRTVSVVNAMNGAVSKTYDRNGNVLTSTDEMGNVTSDSWNARSELVQQVLPDPDGSGPLTSPTLSWTYDLNGDKLTETDSMGRVSAWAYDKLSRMFQETLPDPDGPGPLTSPVITIGFDNDSRRTSETNALSGTTTWAYANTDASQVTSMTLPDPDGSGPLTSPVWAYHYDTDGRRDRTTDPMTHIETTAFDADGHTLSVLDNLGHGPTYAYGHLGEQLTETDALSHTTSEQYDLRLRMVQSTDANGGVTQITLDPAGNRIAVLDPDNNKTTFVLDSLNRETSDTNALNATEYFTWDPSSDMTSTTDRDGRVRDFQHDNLHRQTAEQWMSGNTVVYAIATAYNADNEITSTSDPDSASAMTFDNLGQTLTVDNAGTPNVPHVVLSGSYDAGGDRTSLAASINGTADFLNTYAFDADQRLTSEVQQQQTGGNGVAPKELDFGFNALGQFTSAARYDFIGVGPRTDIATGAYSYDGANRLTGLNYTYAGGGYSIDGYTLGYDNADRLTSAASTVDGSASYGYDSTNQIVSANYSGTNAPPNAAYSFDKNGNRTMTGYQTGTDNQLASDGTFNYTYDPNGNRTVRTRISNAQANDYQVKSFYDYRNRETDEEDFNNSGVLTKHVHLVYDTLDNEIGKQVDDTGGGTYDRTERYVLDGTQPIEQFDGIGNLTERNLNGPSATGDDTVLAQEGIATQGQAGTTNWDLTDNLGTMRYVINNSSAVVDHVVDNAFGQTTLETNSSVAHWDGFAGGHTDGDTKDVLNGERRYDASTGGWTTRDPLGFGGGDANPGRYSGNSPTNLVDHTGMSPQEPWNGGDYNLDPALRSAYAAWMMTGIDPAAFTSTWQPHSSPLDSYATWFNSHVPGGQSWSTAIASNLRQYFRRVENVKRA